MRMLASIVLALAAAPAAALTVATTSSLSNFSLSVIDLRPADGRPAWAGFLPGGYSTASTQIDWSIVMHTVESVWGEASATQSTPRAHASGETGTDRLWATATNGSNGTFESSGHAYNQGTVQVAPRTSLTMRADALIEYVQEQSVFGPFGRVFIEVWTPSGSFQDRLEFWTSDTGAGQVGRALSLTFENQSDAVVEIGFAAYAQAFATAPVPAPASAWLLLAGLGALALRVRTRR